MGGGSSFIAKLLRHGDLNGKAAGAKRFGYLNRTGTCLVQIPPEARRYAMLRVREEIYKQGKGGLVWQKILLQTR